MSLPLVLGVGLGPAALSGAVVLHSQRDQSIPWHSHPQDNPHPHQSNTPASSSDSLRLPPPAMRSPGRGDAGRAQVASSHSLSSIHFPALGLEFGGRQVTVHVPGHWCTESKGQLLHPAPSLQSMGLGPSWIRPCWAPKHSTRSGTPALGAAVIDHPIAQML